MGILLRNPKRDECTFDRAAQIDCEIGVYLCKMRCCHGAPADVVFLVTNPNRESNSGLNATLRLSNRFISHVPLSLIEIRLLPEIERDAVIGHDSRFAGDSFWEDDTRVVKLLQEVLDIVARHVAGNAPIPDVHEIIRTVGHEMHHLWRAREAHRGNPIQPILDFDAGRRMKQVWSNWDCAVQNGTRQIADVPKTNTRWEDIPQSERERIEQGASRTDYIQALYERSAYIVEEIYTKIEQLAFLRIRLQQEPSSAQRSPSSTSLSALAIAIYQLKNQMDSTVNMVGFVTLTLCQCMKRATVLYLRNRCPNRWNPRADSFEVSFFLNARHRGQPPLFVSVYRRLVITRRSGGKR